MLKDYTYEQFVAELTALHEQGVPGLPLPNWTSYTDRCRLLVQERQAEALTHIADWLDTPADTAAMASLDALGSLASSIQRQSVATETLHSWLRDPMTGGDLLERLVHSLESLHTTAEELTR